MRTNKTINTSLEIIKKLQDKQITLFSLTDFARLFKINKQQTVYKIVQRLVKKGTIKKLSKGKYLFLMGKSASFGLGQAYRIANFLYKPSYVSLESALSFYGIITGFPYEIVSMSIKKTKTYLVKNKKYSYTQIKQSLYWGWEKNNGFLIAKKEKALLDYLYLCAKGLRGFDKKEFDLSGLNKKKLFSYMKKANSRQLLKFIK